MTHLEAHGVSIKDSFKLFHEKNPQVYELFEMKAMTAIKMGKRKISSKLIINVLRWEMFIDTEDTITTYKINDSYSSHYARLFAEKNPKYRNVFNYRKLRAEHNERFEAPKGILGLAKKLGVTFIK